MSYQVGAFCYSTSSAAASAAASSVAGSVVSAGGVSYVIDVSSVSGSSITYLFQDIASASSFTKTSAFTAQSCGLLDVQDGLAMGWGVAAAWLFVAGVLFLRRGVNL